MKLHELKPAYGSKKKSKRVGRGVGSGLGKTAGKGNKGQKSRAGKKLGRGFEGGQMPIQRRLPKRGFVNIFRKTYNAINLDRFAKVKENTVIDAKFLLENNFIKKFYDGVRILGKGEIKKPLTFKVNYVTTGAKEKIEKAGGKIEIIKTQSSKLKTLSRAKSRDQN